jgi:hypothetical protein
MAKKKKMTHDEKIEYMRLATAFAGIQCGVAELEMLISLYDLILEKKGDTDLMSLAKVVANVVEKYTKQDSNESSKEDSKEVSED